MEKEFKNFVHEMESLQIEMSLGLVNMNAILDTLDQWTNDHKTVVELLHCPYVYIFNAVKRMNEEINKTFDAMKNGG